MLLTLLSLLAGFAFLILGADWLIRGSSLLAARFGVPSLVIGLTVVAFGTSAPEFAVSLRSATSGSAGIALGNVVGSNIFNLLLILGISSLITPLHVDRKVIRQEVPIMIGISILMLVLALNGTLSRIEGGLLAIGLIGYTGYQMTQAMGHRTRGDLKRSATTAGRDATDKAAIPKSVGQILLGLGFLVLGADWLVKSAVVIAQTFGVSELTIGLTIVAAGTSLPEVATSIVAASRGERDIAVGNVVGSNIFNILGVLGGAALLAPAGIAVSSQALQFDLPVMVAAALISLPIMFTGGRINRPEGLMLLCYYIAYVVFLILTQRSATSLDGFTQVMVWFVIPGTLFVIAVSLVQQWKRGSE